LKDYIRIITFARIATLGHGCHEPRAYPCTPYASLDQDNIHIHHPTFKKERKIKKNKIIFEPLKFKLVPFEKKS